MIDIEKINQNAIMPMQKPEVQNTTAGQSQPQQMWEPEQWGQASNYLGGLLGQGGMTGAMGQAQDWMQQLYGQGGSPFDVSGWYTANAPVYQQQYQDWVNQFNEGDINRAGGIASSGATALKADQARRFAENMAQQQFGAEQNAWENAMARQYGLPGMLGSLGATAGQMGLGAAGQLAGLGGQRAQLPLSVAGMQGTLGSQLSQQQMLPYQLMSGLLGQEQAGVQTFEPNFWTRASGFAGELIPYLMGGGGAPASTDITQGWGGWTPGANELQGIFG